MELSDDELKVLMVGDGGAFDPGEIIGHNYEVLEFIKEGADAEVYRVRNLSDGQEYAAKVPKDGNASGQFEHEVELYNILSKRHGSAHLINVHPSINHEGCPVFIMEFLHGRTLAELLKARTPQSPKRVTRIIRDILSGLSELHAAGIIHCDVNPNNVMLTERGAVLFDLSAGVIAERANARTPRRGTKGYMPPDEHVSYAWDVYSVGVIYYQLLLGEYPSWMQTTDGQNETVKSLAIPEKFGQYLGARPIVEKALRLDPAKRYHNAREMLTQLSNPVHVKRLAIGLGIFKRRHPLSFYLVSGGIILLSVIFTTGYTWAENQAHTLRKTYSLNLDQLDAALPGYFPSPSVRAMLKEIQGHKAALVSPRGATIKIDTIELKPPGNAIKRYAVTLKFSSLAYGKEASFDFPLEWSESRDQYILIKTNSKTIKGVTAQTKVIVELREKKRFWWDTRFKSPSSSFQNLQPAPTGWLSLEDDGMHFDLKISGSYQ